MIAIIFFLMGLVAWLLVLGVVHTITINWQSTVGGSFKQSVKLTGAKEVDFDFTVAGGVVNQQFSLALTKAAVQVIYIFCDQNVTIKTNSTSTPQDTITITAGNPFLWSAGSGIANPLVGDVTTAYVSNPGSTVGNLTIRCLT